MRTVRWAERQKNGAYWVGVSARPDGFTLIEVVLALTIFALMSGILTACSPSATTRSRNRRPMLPETRNSARLAISSAPIFAPRFLIRSRRKNSRRFFQGETDSVTFVSTYSQGMGGRGMAKIQIAADDDAHGRMLLKLEETTPVRIGEEAESTGQSYRVVLQDGIKELRLAYLDPQADEETWEERWDGRERRVLPRAVRLTYLDDQGKPVRWIFPVMMTVLAP